MHKVTVYPGGLSVEVEAALCHASNVFYLNQLTNKESASNLKPQQKAYLQTCDQNRCG